MLIGQNHPLQPVPHPLSKLQICRHPWAVSPLHPPGPSLSLFLSLSLSGRQGYLGQERGSQSHFPRPRCWMISGTRISVDLEKAHSLVREASSHPGPPELRGGWRPNPENLTHTHTRTCTRTRTHTHTHAHTRAHTRAHTHVHTHTCTHTCTRDTYGLSKNQNSQRHRKHCLEGQNVKIKRPLRNWIVQPFI